MVYCSSFRDSLLEGAKLQIMQICSVICMIGFLLSMVKVAVTMPDVALLVTEYWYTPGSLPVTVSVLQ